MRVLAFAIGDYRCAGVVARQTGAIFRASKSGRFMTVKVTVDALMGQQKARFYAGFQPSEMIEWE